MGSHAAHGIVLDALTLGELDESDKLMTGPQSHVYCKSLMTYLHNLGRALCQDLLDDLILVLGVELRSQRSLGGGVIVALGTVPIVHSR